MMNTYDPFQDVNNIIAERNQLQMIVQIFLCKIKITRTN